MIGWERRVLLRYYLEQGMTKTELAERFGISRQTIHRWILKGELDRDLDVETVKYGPRPAVPTKLDRYKGIILSRLAEYPVLFQNSAERESVSLQGFVGPQTRHSRSRWHVLEPVSYRNSTTVLLQVLQLGEHRTVGAVEEEFH